MMIDPTHPIAKLLREDRRYDFDAYVFVFEALRYAQEVLGMGSESSSVGEPEPATETRSGSKPSTQTPKHLSGQELCEAIRKFALEQYGYMAKCVLNQWGVTKTGDFGEIVFSLIRIGEMRKTPDDRREDFNDVYDFEEGLTRQFKITIPD